MQIMVLAICLQDSERPALQPTQWAKMIGPSVSVISHMLTRGSFICCKCQTLATTTYFPEIIFPLTEVTNPDTTWWARQGKARRPSTKCGTNRSKRNKSTHSNSSEKRPHWHRRQNYGDHSSPNSSKVKCWFNFLVFFAMSRYCMTLFLREVEISFIFCNQKLTYWKLWI